ncbi:MAG: nucleotidyltransferase family protein, partial [Agathobacter sp.]|nr:nucleotidyltransferase family protein [Agathobacter sp.]
MKTVAYFSDYTLELADEKRKVDAIRELTQADRIVSVMSHGCLQNGLLPSEPSKERAQKGLDAGANLILQMSSYASLSSLGIYAFAAARFLDQLNLVDEVVFEVDDTNLEELTKIVYLLIANTRDFQQKVTVYRNSGMVFNDAQAKAIGEAVPGGEEMMKSWHNHFAVECMRAL